MSKPNLFLVGAPKAGTTSLFVKLGHHPDVYVPPRIKEPHYFARQAVAPDDPRAVRREGDYLRLFSGRTDERVVAEASPSYLRDEQAPALIRQFNPDAMIIAMLRNPVDRAYSHYLMSRRLGRTERPFAAVVERRVGAPRVDPRDKIVNLAAGDYGPQLERYLSVFPADQVKVLVFEEFIRDVEGSLAQVFDHCGIEDRSSELASVTARNQASSPRHPVARWVAGNEQLKAWTRRIVPFELRQRLAAALLYRASDDKETIDPHAVDLLAEHYRDSVRQTSRLLGRPLPWAPFFSTTADGRRGWGD
jgi:hypothetical protein